MKETVMDLIEKYKVDAVVVGSRGYGVLKRVVLGSLSTFLVHNSPVPVIVCRSAPTSDAK